MSNASTKVTDLDSPLALTSAPYEHRYVDQSGQDAGATGDDDAPFATLAACYASITDATAEKPYLVHVAPGSYVWEPPENPWIFIKGAGQESTGLYGPDGGDTERSYGDDTYESFTTTVQDCYVDSLIITRNAGFDSPVESQFCTFRFINCVIGHIEMTGSGATGTDPFIFDFLDLRQCQVRSTIQAHAINLQMYNTVTLNITENAVGVDTTTTEGLIQNWFNCGVNFVNLTGSLICQPRNTKCTRVTLNGVDCSYTGDATSWPSGGATNNTQLLSSATMSQLGNGTLITRLARPVSTMTSTPFSFNSFVHETIVVLLDTPGASQIDLPANLIESGYADGKEFTVIDGAGDAGTNTITVDSSLTDLTFVGGGTTSTITTNGGIHTYKIAGDTIYLKSKNY